MTRVYNKSEAVPSKLARSHDYNKSMCSCRQSASAAATVERAVCPSCMVRSPGGNVRRQVQKPASDAARALNLCVREAPHQPRLVHNGVISGNIASSIRGMVELGLFLRLCGCGRDYVFEGVCAVAGRCDSCGAGAGQLWWDDDGPFWEAPRFLIF